jgi:tRNA modification GTPase
VGKSSLVNAIAGYERSLVAAVPGTTRDAVSAVVAIDGWPVELIDTAGLRTEATGVEQAGIALARSVIESADLCLWVVDASGPPVWPPENLRHAPRLVVNKVDLPPAWDLSAAAGVRVSAKTAAGLDGLLRAVAAALVKEPPPTGAAVPFTPFLCHAVADAGRLLREDRLANALALIRQARLGLEM